MAKRRKTLENMYGVKIHLNADFYRQTMTWYSIEGLEDWSKPKDVYS